LFYPLLFFTPPLLLLTISEESLSDLTELKLQPMIGGEAKMNFMLKHFWVLMAEVININGDGA